MKKEKWSYTEKEISLLNFQFQGRREPEVFQCLQPFSWGILQLMLMSLFSMPNPEKNLPYLPFPVVSDSIRSSNMTNRHQDNENIIRCCISSIMLFSKRSTIKSCSPTFNFFLLLPDFLSTNFSLKNSSLYFKTICAKILVVLKWKSFPC